MRGSCRPGTILEWTTDATGRLRVPGLHDAGLLSLSYVGGQSLQLALCGAAGEHTTIVLDEPFVLTIAELWDGAIIADIRVWEADRVPPPELWAEDENGWNALLRGRVDVADLKAAADRLVEKHAGATLLVVSCAYGGAWAALCRQVRIQQARDC